MLAVKEICHHIISLINCVCSKEFSEDVNLSWNNLLTTMKSIRALKRPEINLDKLDALINVRPEDLYKLNTNDRADHVLRIIMDTFRKEWENSILLVLNITICQEHFRKFESLNYNFENSARATCHKILKTILSVIGCCNNMQTASHTLLLSLYQILTNLPLFVNGYLKSCFLIQNFAIFRLTECMKKMEEIPWETAALNLPCSEFLDLMDLALGSLDEIAEYPAEWMQDDGDKGLHLKSLINELLCHSMSTAQVTINDNDRRAILSKSQTILQELESLQDDLVGESVPSVKLSADMLSENLCSLERLVNAAMLRLILHIGGASHDPLRQLVQFACPLNNTNSDEKCLEGGIALFDTYIDMLMQIGSFAVSCTSNLRRSMELRSCLASFESMEVELVSCVTNLNNNYTRENKRTLRMLVEHWMQQFTHFLRVLHSIVDPAAYTEIVKEYVSGRVKDCNGANQSNIALVIKEVAEAAKTLQGVVKASIEHEPSDKNKAKLHSLAESIKRATLRCQQFELTTTNSEGVEDADKTVALRRIDQLQTAIDELWEWLAEQIVDFKSSSTSQGSIDCQSVLRKPAAKDYYKLCPAEEIENGIDSLLTSSGDDHFDLLTPHKARGNLLIKEAIFYNTPKRTPTAMRSTTKKREVPSSARRRCFRPASPCISDPSGPDQKLDLTQLLENLTCQDSTFSLNNSTIITAKQSEFRGRQLLELLTGWEDSLEIIEEGSGSEAPAGGSTIPSSTLVGGNVLTPDRMQDILMVDKKIEGLNGKFDGSIDHVHGE